MVSIVVLALAPLSVQSAQCCYDQGLTPDQCGTASDCDGAADYCSSTADNCKDCDGVFCDDTPKPSPPSPVPAPTPSPVPAEAKCCYDKDLTVDQCGTASDCDDSSDYCSASAANCADCSGVFCAADPVPSPVPPPAPTPVPVPTPTPEPVEAKCCYDKDLIPDQCGTASDCDDSSDYCSASAANCADCSGVFCASEPAPSPVPTPVSTYKCVSNQCVQDAAGVEKSICNSFCGSTMV